MNIIRLYIIAAFTAMLVSVPAAATIPQEDSTDNSAPMKVHRVAIDANRQVGTTRGAGSVSASGAACYQFPIELPRDEFGYSPNLEIAYNSMTGNGILGVGWNLVGISSITRCASSPFYDNESKEVTLTNVDNIALDGKRLIRVSGQSMTTGTEYRLEDNPTIKVVCWGSGFKLFNPDGTVCEFGMNSNSRIGSNGAKWLWLLNRSTDLRGRTITYSYEGLPSNNEFYISRIDYDVDKTVSFSYELRPDNECKYFAGQSVHSSYRLKSISASVQDTQISRYQFDYEYDGCFSKLTDVTQYGQDNACYNPTHIEYEGESMAYSVPAQLNVNKNGGRVHYGDFNGDGRTDFLSLPIKQNYSTNDSVYVYLSRGSRIGMHFELVGSLQLSEAFRDVYVSDIDGDGHSNIVIINANQSTSRHTYYSVENDTIIYKDRFDIDYGVILEGDYDGDGRTEFINMLNYKVYDAQGHIIASAANINWNDAYDKRKLLFIPSTKSVQDFNGNGKEDILVIGNDKLRLYELQNGYISEVSSFATTKITNTHSIACGDFNGDGYTDILSRNGTQCKVYLSTGCKFVLFCQFSIDVDIPVLVGDFNGDGRADLFHLNLENGTYRFVVRIFNGAGFTAYQSAAPVHPGMEGGANLFYSYSTIADFDGDGRTEYGCFYFDDKAVIRHFSDDQNLRVSTISDGLGATTAFHYASSCESGICTNEISGFSYPISVVSQPLWLLSAITVEDATCKKKTSFRYKNPLMHLQGKGFLGFGETRVSDHKGTTVSKYAVNATLGFLHLTSQEHRASNGQPISYIECATSVNWLSQTRPYRYVPYIYKEVFADSLTGNVRIRTTDVDAYGNPTLVCTAYGEGLAETTETSYKNLTGSTWVIGLPERTTKTTDDGEGEAWQESFEVSYNSKTLPVKKTKYINNQETPVSDEELTYDVSGNLLSHSTKSYASTNALVTTYTYTDDKQRLASTTSPYGLTTTFTYDGLDRIHQISEQAGDTVSFQYDKMGRIIYETHSDGKFMGTVYNWDFSLSNSVWCKSEMSNGGNAHRIWYDESGREIRSSQSDCHGVNLKQDRIYDSNGMLLGVSLPFKSALPTNWVSYLYDGYGRLIGEWQTNGSSTAYTYDGNTINTTKNGITSGRSYDTMGRLVKVNDPAGNIQYILRADGQVSKVEALGVTTTFDYDGYGRRISINDPSAGSRTCTYNGEGQIEAEADANGRTVYYSYDALGRLSVEERPELKTCYTYDEYNRIVGISSTNGTGREYSYDCWGRIACRKDLLPNEKYLKREYSYDQGQVASIVYSNQAMNLGTEQFVYKFGKLYSRQFGQRQIWIWGSENDMGQCTSDHSMLMNRSYSFDSYGLPTGRSMSINGNKYLDTSLSYDTNTSNLSWRKDNTRNLQENFDYDELNRLVNYDGNFIEYDAKGNILYKSDADLSFTYERNDKPYAVTGIGMGFSPTLLHYAYQRITYNSFERPDTITDNGVTTTFAYYADGTRAMMRTDRNNLPNRYYVDNIYEEEQIGDSTVYILYLGGDAYTAPTVYVANDSSNALYYLGRDHLGSITHIVDEGGNLLYEYSYDAWGRLRNPDTHVVYATGLDPTLLFGRGYCGHEHLSWCGLINMNARLYDPTLGRFLSPDNYVQLPDNGQDFNRYSYCLNNPLKYSDPSGDIVWWAVVGLAGGVLNFAAKYYNGQINNVRDGAAAFLIGFVATSTGYVMAGAAFAAAGGAAGGTGGFLAGAASGLTGSSISMPIESIGNNSYFGDPLMTWQEYLASVSFSGLFGGAFNGFSATANGRKFWNGDLPAYPQWGLNFDSEVFSTMRPISDGQSSQRPLQKHHFATNKNKAYTPQMKEIANRYNLNLEEDWNIEYLPHSGRHPNAYHNWVLNQMLIIDRMPNMTQQQFILHFNLRVKQPVIDNPDMLYKKFWIMK